MAFSLVGNIYNVSLHPKAGIRFWRKVGYIYDLMVVNMHNLTSLRHQTVGQTDTLQTPEIQHANPVI